MEMNNRVREERNNGCVLDILRLDILKGDQRGDIIAVDIVGDGYPRCPFGSCDGCPFFLECFTSVPSRCMISDTFRSI